MSKKLSFCVNGLTSPEKLPKALKLIIQKLEEHDDEIKSLRRIVFDYLLRGKDVKEVPVPIPVPCPDDFKKWQPLLLMTACIFGEARGEPYDAKVAVAWVIKNRLKKDGWFGKNLKEVILKPYQFSCFNENDPNKEKMKNPLEYEPFSVWVECYKVAKEVEAEKIPDPTDGATHYFDESLAKNPPAWAKKLQFKKKIGRFYFYG